MRWEWLKVGRRIEWVTAAFSLFFYSITFILLLAFGPHPGLVGVLITVVFATFWCTGVLMTTALPAFLLLTHRRSKELAEAAAGIASRSPVISRSKLYTFMTILTFVTAIIMVTHFAPNGHPTHRFIELVFFWTFISLVVVIFINEIEQLRKTHNSERR
ncbi:MAG: hypothetical protein ACRD30_04975 [Bryobacteraceae bacterium]